MANRNFDRNYYGQFRTCNNGGDVGGFESTHSSIKSRGTGNSLSSSSISRTTTASLQQKSSWGQIPLRVGIDCRPARAKFNTYYATHKVDNHAVKDIGAGKKVRNINDEKKTRLQEKGDLCPESPSTVATEDSVLVVDSIEVEPMPPLLSEQKAAEEHADENKSQSLLPFRFGKRSTTEKKNPEHDSHWKCRSEYVGSPQLIRRLSASTREWMERMEKVQRVRASRLKISQTLLLLRGAYEHKYEEEMRASERNEEYASVCPLDKKKQGVNNLYELTGDYGLALFAPLDARGFEPLSNQDERGETCKSASYGDHCDSAPDEASLDNNKETGGGVSEHDEFPVIIDPEPQTILSWCPRILTKDMMKQLMDGGLPDLDKIMAWKRLYSVLRDGDSFETMLNSCSNHKHTVIVMRTDRDDIIGGYADMKWERQEGYDMGRSFYGSGQAFLFSNNPWPASKKVGGDVFEKPNDLNELKIFRWTGVNRYCQVCDVDDGQLAMGGGGAFGLIVQENFSWGTTGRCSTFGNPPLTRDKDGRFGIIDFEVYGFKSCFT